MEKSCASLSFSNYEQLMPQTLKPAVASALNQLLAPIQEEYQLTPAWKDVTEKAYPPPELKKKEKKVKNLGTRFPGGSKDVEAKPDGQIEGIGKDKVNVTTGAEEAIKNLDVKSNGTK